MTTETIDPVENMKPYGKTSYLNLTVCSTRDIARCLVEKTFIADPGLGSFIETVELEGKSYKIICEKL
jgi:hypothetical protein